MDNPRRSRIPLPAPDYLALLGEIVYTIAYMEWQLLGDLAPLSRHEPLTRESDRLPRCVEEANRKRRRVGYSLHHNHSPAAVQITSDLLSKCPTGAIVDAVEAAAKSLSNQQIAKYLISACAALRGASTVRNDILHSNPMSFGPELAQVLQRRIIERDGDVREITFTTDELHRALQRVATFGRAMSTAREKMEHLLFD